MKAMAAGLLVMLAGVGAVGAGDALDKVKLIPGVNVEFEVPGSPSSLADIKRGSGAKAASMGIKLPANYNPSKSYPLLVFLSGGDGGRGGEMHQADPFLGGEGYVLVNMPLFRRELTGDTDDQRLVLTPFDAEHAVPAFRTMLAAVRRVVPNLDPKRSVLAGFSNGGYAAALMLWSGDAELLSHFASFILVEGGFWLGLDEVADTWPGRRFQPAALETLRGKRILLLHGGQTQPADRIPWNEQARRTAAALQQAGVDATALPMPNTGHDFPPAAMGQARDWLKAE